jgi:hypothetical protein
MIWTSSSPRPRNQAVAWPRASWNDIVDRVLLANPGKLGARVVDAAQFYRVSRATVWSALRKCRVMGAGVLQR